MTARLRPTRKLSILREGGKSELVSPIAKSCNVGRIPVQSGTAGGFAHLRSRLRFAVKVLCLKEWVQSPIFVVYPIWETKPLQKRKSLTVPIRQRTYFDHGLLGPTATPRCAVEELVLFPLFALALVGPAPADRQLRQKH